MTSALARAPRHLSYAGAHPEDFEPPRGLQTFSVQLRDGRGRTALRALGALSDEQLGWCLRSLEAERQRRAEERRAQALFVADANGHRLSFVPEDGLQFVLKL